MCCSVTGHNNTLRSYRCYCLNCLDVISTETTGFRKPQSLSSILTALRSLHPRALGFHSSMDSHLYLEVDLEVFTPLKGSVIATSWVLPDEAIYPLILHACSCNPNIVCLDSTCMASSSTLAVYSSSNYNLVVVTMYLLKSYIFATTIVDNYIMFCSLSVPQDGWTALMKASFNGHCDAVHVLLSAGAKVHQHNMVRY